MKREFVQLAHKLDFSNLKQHIGGWWYSEKLDGERCFWDGGASRGLSKASVPYANCAKDSRYENEQIATGLWSRYGNVIHAPNWFLDYLPQIPLDGELYSCERTHRQFIHSWIKKIEPIDSEWRHITYMVFDSPPLITILRDGEINGTNFKKVFKDCWSWGPIQDMNLRWEAKANTRFESTYTMLQDFLKDYIVVKLLTQYVLPFPQPLAIARLEGALKKIVESGGEGLMVRNPNAVYECCRSHNMLKVKPFDDAEGTVIGYISGRETDLGSKLLGMMGALILQMDNGIIFYLSGFTESERRLGNLLAGSNHADAVAWATANPEKEVPEWIEAVAFPRGTRITFKYRGLSADSVPAEARYWRKRND